MLGAHRVRQCPHLSRSLNSIPALPICGVPALRQKRCEMALASFDKTYSVGIQLLDDQHADLFDALNELHSAMLKGQANSVVGGLLQDLLAYIRSHFAAEEAMLAKARYPGLAEHQMKHRNLTAQLAEYAERFKRGQGSLSMQLLTFWRDLLITHILRDDRAYSDWMVQAGTRS